MRRNTGTNNARRRRVKIGGLIGAAAAMLSAAAGAAVGGEGIAVGGVAGLATQEQTSLLPPDQGPPMPQLHAPYWARHIAMINEGQPAEGPDGRALVRELGAVLVERTKKIVEPMVGSEGVKSFDISDVFSPRATPQDRSRARGVLEELLKTDLPARMAEFDKATRWVVEAGDGVLLERLMPEMGEARRLVQFQIARMSLAQERGDLEEWRRAWDQTSAIAELVGFEPVAISMMVQSAIRAQINAAARRLIASGGADEAMLAWLDSRLAAVPPLRLERAMRGEALMAENLMEFVYARGPQAGVKYLRSYIFEEAGRRDIPYGGPDGGPGGLGAGMPPIEAHRQLIREAYELASRLAMEPLGAPGQAEATEELKGMIRRSLVLQIVMNAPAQMRPPRMREASDREGTRTIVTLERYKIMHGRYPDRLADLVPALRPAVPEDPYTGGVLGYLPPRAEPYQGGRAYLLYAAGGDGKDNGGVINFDEPRLAHQGAKGLDILLNTETPTK